MQFKSWLLFSWDVKLISNHRWKCSPTISKPFKTLQPRHPAGANPRCVPRIPHPAPRPPPRFVAEEPELDGWPWRFGPNFRPKKCWKKKCRKKWPILKPNCSGNFVEICFASTFQLSIKSNEVSRSRSLSSPSALTLEYLKPMQIFPMGTCAGRYGKLVEVGSTPKESLV